MKKVSCISLAGCCWGTKRASKFQKPVSTYLSHNYIDGPLKMGERLYLLVGISTNPWLKKICLNSARTLFNGCRAPAFCIDPRALKLYALKLVSFHDPLAS